MKKRLTYPVFFLLVLVLASCQRQPDYLSEMDALDSALLRVDSAATVFEAVSLERGIELNQTINGEVKRVANAFTAEMDKNTAMLISQYKSTANIVKDWSSKHRRIGKEIQRTRHQLTNLRDALKIGATEDSEGTAFTPEYVDRVFNQEITVAGHLVDQIHDMAGRLERAESSYASMQPQVQQVLDGLPATPAE